MNKRAIAILGAIFILIVATLGFLIYSRSNSDSNDNTNTPADVPVDVPIVETPETPIIPEEPVSTAVRLTDEPVVSPILFYQGNGISYFNGQGQLFQTDLQDGDSAALLSNKRELSIALKGNITKILWPQAGNSFIAEFGSTQKPNWSFYDSGKAAYVDIPQQVYSLDWLPGGDRILFTWVDSTGKATLNEGNPDTTDYRTLTDLYEPDNVISVSPDGKNVLFYRTQTVDTTKNTINMVSSDGLVFTSVVKDGFNTGVKWSPDSLKFLFTKRDSGTQTQNLWMADITTGQLTSLGVSTSISKVAWSRDSQTVFAGVPVSGVAGQGLTQDTLYKIAAPSGSQKKYEPGLTVDAQNLFLNTSESILFFRNAQDNSLYYIPVN